jgi:hypothetical protein
MTSRTERRWVIVQHSGFGYTGDPQFEKGLEVREVSTMKDRRLVERVGGLVFDDWKRADDFTEEATYDPDHTGLIPNAKGTFSDKEIDGLRIYIPVRTVVG